MVSLVFFLFIEIILFSKTSLSAKITPNILFILADDLGWGQVGFYENDNNEIQTPNMNNLALSEGIVLMRHYVHYACSPTRSSLQSGRLPVHVNLRNAALIDDHQGVPINMTCIATKLRSSSKNYTTHIVGKWDAGTATFNQIPYGRGYDSSFIYFGHDNNYWTEIDNIGCGGKGLKYYDLWQNNKPAYGVNGTQYEEIIFAQHVYNLIDKFGEDKRNKSPQETQPFFLVYAPHIAHAPLRIPKEYLLRFDNDENLCGNGNHEVYPGYTNGTDFHCRSIEQSMVNFLDAIIGNITNKLHSNGLWNDTLIVFSGDNGGCYTLNSTAGNNYPLRGAKYVPFEGGIRSTSFVSGGYLPQKRRGTKEYGMIHIADWYATFCALNGINIIDENAKKANLPQVDGLNMWPLISGQNLTSPRTEIPIDDNVIISGDYKLILGTHDYASWSSKVFPNSSSPEHLIQGTMIECGGKGCLFDIVKDMTEHNDISSTNADIVNNLKNRLNEVKKTYYNNSENGIDICPSNVTEKCGCWVAQNVYNGFYGPYQVLPNNTKNYK